MADDLRRVPCPRCGGDVPFRSDRVPRCPTCARDRAQGTSGDGAGWASAALALVLLPGVLFGSRVVAWAVGPRVLDAALEAWFAATVPAFLHLCWGVGALVGFGFLAWTRRLRSREPTRARVRGARRARVAIALAAVQGTGAIVSGFVPTT